MKESVEKILEEYKEIVLSKAGLYSMIGAERDDLIQEGMIGLVKAYNSYDESKGASFKTFAELCINRQMISAVKAAGRLKNLPLNDYVSLYNPLGDDDDSSVLIETLESKDENNPEQVVVYNELLQLLLDPEKKYFSKLEQEVLKHLLGGLSYKEIAATMNKTEKQIDNAIQRIKNKIRIFLA